MYTHTYPCVSGSCSRYVSLRSLYGATSVLFFVIVVLVANGSVLGGGIVVEVATTEPEPTALIILSFILSSLAQLCIAVVAHNTVHHRVSNSK
jgi:biotin transporter BioY